MSFKDLQSRAANGKIVIGLKPDLVCVPWGLRIGTLPQFWNEVMDFIFVSMPYAKFDSKWFANVPNINLGILNALLSEKGKKVKTFHFHLAFEAFLMDCNAEVRENFLKLSAQFGVEFLGLDYVFASLLFEDRYLASRGRFEERLSALQLTLDDFESLREVAGSFVGFSFSNLSQYLKPTTLVGFSCSHYQLSGSLLMCHKIKDACPDILTVVGGKDCAGAFGQELLSNIDLVDFVGIGESEVTIASLLEHVEDSNRPFYNVICRDETGEIRRSPLRENVSVKSLPFPRYDFQDLPVEASEVILPLEFGRGCPWGRCTFCPDESYNVRCQSKTAKQLKAELEYYQDISKALRNFIILDSDALKDQEIQFVFLN